MMATASALSGANKEKLQALQKYTACDIADALLKLQVPNAGFLPDLNLYAPSSTKTEITIAPASTVIFASKTGPNNSDFPESNIPTGSHWVDLTQPETIVVMKQADGQKCAILGGIMALRMKVLSAKGIVVNGRVRDIAELGETGLPVRILFFVQFGHCFPYFRKLHTQTLVNAFQIRALLLLFQDLGVSADEAIRYGQNQPQSSGQDWRLNLTLFRYL
jgi:regulator of RNase E activity RraA